MVKRDGCTATVTMCGENVADKNNVTAYIHIYVCDW